MWQHVQLLPDTYTALLYLGGSISPGSLGYELSNDEKEGLLDTHKLWISKRWFGASDVCSGMQIPIIIVTILTQEWSETLASMACYHALECFMTEEDNQPQNTHPEGRIWQCWSHLQPMLNTPTLLNLLDFGTISMSTTILWIIPAQVYVISFCR